MTDLAERETTPPVNLARFPTERWYAFWLRLERAIWEDRLEGESCAAYHQRKLGRQTRCWVGGSERRRYYVWEAPLWRVYVHGIQGISFEVPLEGDPKPWDAVRDYCSKLGLSVEP